MSVMLSWALCLLKLCTETWGREFMLQLLRSPAVCSPQRACKCDLGKAGAWRLVSQVVSAEPRGIQRRGLGALTRVGRRKRS